MTLKKTPRFGHWDLDIGHSVVPSSSVAEVARLPRLAETRRNSGEFRYESALRRETWKYCHFCLPLRRVPARVWAGAVDRGLKDVRGGDVVDHAGHANFAAILQHNFMANNLLGGVRSTLH